MADMRVSIVIPVYNEEAGLARNIDTLLAFVRGLKDGREYSICIAVNGSTDRTAEIARQLAAEHYDVIWQWTPQSGRGRALRAAWRDLASSAAVVGYMDADLSTELHALPAVIDALESGADVAIGTRLHPESRTGRSVKREIVSRGYNILVRLLLDCRVTDAQCGFKFIRSDRALQVIDDIKNDNWFFDTELLALARHKKWRIAEVPVVWAENRKSTVRLLPTIIENFCGILRLRKQLNQKHDCR